MDFAFRRAVAEARRRGDLYFAGLLPEDRIVEAFGRARWIWQGWIYSPAVTLWVFLAQCLSADHSCREAVAQLIAWRLTRGLKRCSADTGAYCTARERIPEAACLQLARETGRAVDEQASPEWRWRSRRVLDVDGSTITMPDTSENQAEYPQVPGQRRGCGFPIARIVVVFSLAVGTVLDAAIGRYQGKQTGENSLFRTLHGLLREGDVVLADRYFSGWFDLMLLQQRDHAEHEYRLDDDEAGPHRIHARQQDGGDRCRGRDQPDAEHGEQARAGRDDRGMRKRRHAVDDGAAAIQALECETDAGHGRLSSEPTSVPQIRSAPSPIGRGVG